MHPPRKNLRVLAAAASLCLCLSCGWRVGTGLPPLSPASGQEIAESFADADRPVFVQGEDADYRYQKPWNYDKAWNSGRRYPLVVGLHGAGGSSFAPCVVGNDAQMKAYPCFFLAPTSPGGWGADAAWVRDEVETFIRKYRIDADRLYLVGFSMGGSGSYEFANLSWDEHGRLYAAILRCAGQSQTGLRPKAAAATSVWYHIGLEDDAARVRVAEEAYRWMKAYPGNAGALESKNRDEVGPFSRLTKTLSSGGIEFFKKSEYAGMGHDYGPPFSDPAALEWLFARSLSERNR